MSDRSAEETADKLAGEVFEKSKAIYKKVRTLLRYFGYEKRSEDNTTRITELLSERNVLLNPSIMKFGETWKLKIDDIVYLVPRIEEVRDEIEPKKDLTIYEWGKDTWFTDVLEKEFRTEREVETKFLLPLLNLLGYREDDRHDGMIINTAHGSKQTKLEVDFALFDFGNEILEGQVLLIAEAKNEKLLYRQVEIEKAQRQVKSYAVWLGCHFGLVTDSKIIQIIDLFPKISGMKVIFECKREELKNKFVDIYKLISKESLSSYYKQLTKEKSQ